MWPLERRKMVSLGGKWQKKTRHTYPPISYLLIVFNLDGYRQKKLKMSSMKKRDIKDYSETILFGKRKWGLISGPKQSPKKTQL